jgi:hypothetical protein
MAINFSGGRCQSTRREPSTMGKRLVNFITCDCESSAPFFATYKAGREPMPFTVYINVYIFFHSLPDLEQMRPLTWALKEVDLVVHQRQSSIHAQEI